MKFIKLPLLLFSILVLVSACRRDGDDQAAVSKVSDFGAESALRWNTLFLDIERYAAGYRPGPAPRMLGITNFAAYEALVSGMPGYNSLAVRFSVSIPKADASREYHWPSVLNALYGSMYIEMFPDISAELKNRISALEAELEQRYKGQVADDIYQRSRDHGKSVARVMLDWAATDSWGHNAHRDPFRGYVPPVGPGLWVPTFPGPGNGMFPYWGKVRVWALPDAAKVCRPPYKHTDNSNSEYYTNVIEVYNKTVPSLTYEDKWIAEFWSDDLVDLTFSPGPRWVAILNQVIEKEKSNLETAIFAYAKTSMALNDAAVGCWNSKFTYNVERPITAIHRTTDPNWETALYNPLTGLNNNTPSFPAYPSGHSTMGAAAAEAMTSIFGPSYRMTDNCHYGRSEFLGLPRTFASFYEMAEENAYSRIPLGVHFRMDCEEGVRYGYEIGRYVNQLPWRG